MLIALAVLGLLAAFVAVPIDTGPLESHPEPIREYAAAVASYDAMRAGERGLVVHDGGSLIYLQGHRTPRVVVLVHGITNSPRQFRELAEQLHARGYTVVVPRLPRHALVPGDVDALRTLTAEKYRDYADHAVDDAAGLGDSVFVVGLSAGGNVAAWLGQHRREVTRAIIISPAITLARVPHLLDGPAMNLAQRVPNVTIYQTPDTARAHAYFGFSTRAIGETLRFGASVVEDAERDAPASRDFTVVVNRNDRTVDEAPAARLAELWGHRDGVSVRVYTFDRQLGLPHDIIDVSQECAAPRLVYPVLIALLEKRPVPPADAALSPCATATEVLTSR